MSNLPNPDPTMKSTGGREIHQSADPLPPPIMHTEPLSDDPSSEGRLGRTIPKQERPLGGQPAQQGGVALGGHESQALPMGKASGAPLGGHESQAMSMGKPSTADKMIGKTEKVLGKMSKNPEMQEKGELRETGGKAAVSGQFRAT